MPDHESDERQTVPAAPAEITAIRPAPVGEVPSLSWLTGKIAHHLNNVLTPILGYTDLCAVELDESHELQLYLQQIRRAVLRSQQLIFDMIAASGVHPLELEVVELSAVLSAQWSELRELCGRNMHLSMNLCPQACRVIVDRHLLQKVVRNLVVNARDALPDGGDIVIKTALVERFHAGPSHTDGVERKSAVRLSVRDSGVGIDAEIRGRIFDPFFTTKHVALNPGLGLSEVHGIVSQLGGRVIVICPPGEGTTVEVTLPCVSD